MIAPHRITGTDEALCVRHGKRLKPGEACALCPRAPMDAAVVRGGKPKRDGSHAEEALYAALDVCWWEAAPGGYPSEPMFVSTMWLRQYPWGAYLSPPRRFTADAGFPVARLLVEVEGVAHKIGHQQKHDVVRRQLAEAAGWRVLSVLPEQVHSGEAVALIAAALSKAHGAGEV